MITKTIIPKYYFILGVLFICFSGFHAYKSWQTHEIFNDVNKASQAISYLLEAAGNWAVERGITNTALNSKTVITPERKDKILQRRQAADSALRNALREVATLNFVRKDQYIEEVKYVAKNTELLRNKADKQVTLTRSLRDQRFIERWIPSMTRLITISQILRQAITQKAASVNGELGRQERAKHYVWKMSEYAGKVRAIVGALISSHSPIDGKTHQVLSEYHGYVLSAFEEVKTLTKDKDATVVRDLEYVENGFFGSFNDLRQSIIKAGLDGVQYPIDSSKWIELSTQEIDKMLAVQHSLRAETETYTERLLDESLYQLIISVILLVFSFVIFLASSFGARARQQDEVEMPSEPATNRPKSRPASFDESRKTG
ncbi:MAG: nitrate- and nitrite sensing domain-containing protein [Alphaproteobacteria bacterium]